MSDLKERFEDPTISPAEDTRFTARRLPGVPSGEAQGMLPGMAAIAMFLLLVSMLTAFHMLRAPELPRTVRLTVFAVSSLIVVGSFGLLRLRRWGWALVTGGCVFGAAGNFWAFHASHIGPYLIQGLFALCFFFYLVRPETRTRLR